MSNLQEDTFLNAKVFLDEKYILLSPDVPVTREMLDRLSRWGFQELYTEKGTGDSQEPIPVAKQAVNQVVVEQSLEEQKKQKETLTYYHNCLAFLNETFDRYQLDNTLRLSVISDKIKEMKTFTRDYRQSIFSLSDSPVEGVSYNVCHSVKTVFLSLILAETLKMPVHRQIELGITALLHRIGMLRLPPELYMANRRLRPEEKKALYAYPVLSFRIIKGANFPMSVALGALDHCERMDGTGYPRQLAGDKISLYGKIISVTSSYTAAVARRPYKTGMDGHTGILDMIKLSGSTYDHTILRALVYTLSIFPIGTYVQLSDGSRGIVIRTDPENPKYPFIKLILNPQGAPFPERPVFQPGEGNPVTISRPLTSEEKQEMDSYYK